VAQGLYEQNCQQDSISTKEVGYTEAYVEKS
jgi:hypothetical protein